MKKDRVYIIAEAGVNHNGDFNNALKLVDAAKESGADAVKFQKFKSEKMTSRFAQKAQYQKETTSQGESQLDMLKKLELGYDEHLKLIEYCREVGIDFLSSPFDVESVRELDSLGINIFKIPSGEITNYPYLKEIALTGKPVVLSTGMSDMNDVHRALQVLKNGGGEITILHCNTEYPSPYEDVNLKAMNTIELETGCRIGYSDHTLGIEIPVAAVAMGACVIEKHFTLDKTMEGPDHRASLEPWELKAMVKGIRNIESALGNGVKTPSPSELRNIDIARKSIVAGGVINQGDVFSEENLTVKRPGTGINPMEWNNLLGRKALRGYGEDEIIDKKELL